MFAIHLPAGLGEKGLRVSIKEAEHKIVIEFEMIDLMTDHEYILSSKAFIEHFHKSADGSFQPTLIALKAGVQELKQQLGEGDSIPCQIEIPLPQTDWSIDFADRESPFEYAQLPPYEEELDSDDSHVTEAMKETQKSMLTRNYAVLDLVETKQSFTTGAKAKMPTDFI